MSIIKKKSVENVKSTHFDPIPFFDVMPWHFEIEIETSFGFSNAKTKTRLLSAQNL